MEEFYNNLNSLYEPLSKHEYFRQAICSCSKVVLLYFFPSFSSYMNNDNSDFRIAVLECISFNLAHRNAFMSNFYYGMIKESALRAFGIWMLTSDMIDNDDILNLIEKLHTVYYEVESNNTNANKEINVHKFDTLAIDT